jgi:hypothetical protein
MAHTLSKSDFKIARDCASKLYYKKLRYPSLKDDDPFLELLADGGYMIEAIARLLYPGAVEMDYSAGRAAAAEQTREALKADIVTLFEATLIAGARLARVDILAKRGNEFDLIEVKSTSYDSAATGAIGEDGIPRIPRGARGGYDRGKWDEKLDDIAFQVHVLAELFPGAKINPYLLVPDRAKTTTVDVIHQLFTVERSEGEFAKVRGTFNGDAEALRANHFLTRVDVSREVTDRLEDVRADAAVFEASLAPKLERIVVPIAVSCHKCEYRVPAGGERSGFRECWGALAAASPSVLDLYKAGAAPARDHVNDLISSGRAGMYDVDANFLVRKDGTRGADSVRQLIQIENTKKGAEWVSGTLAAELQRHPYPHHFIDFETSALAVPYHAGMRPYETVAFQWSCHTIDAAGATPRHAAWINVEDYFPNFEFARSLREGIGDGGSVFMWSHHERTVLAGIRAQMQGRDEEDPELHDWLEKLGTRLVDMNKICLLNYFHPIMGKRTSIKNVLDAVWTSDLAVRGVFPKYAGAEKSPYGALPAEWIEEEELAVTHGTGAVVAYQKMLYGEFRERNEVRGRLRQMLLDYCEVDTAAMVMIWKHWERITAAT